MIEPKPAYVHVLQRVMHRVPKSEIHGVAVTEPGIRSVRMWGAGPTGAWVASAGKSMANKVVCPAATLDELLSYRI